MKRVLLPFAIPLFLLLGSLVLAQSRGGNWPTYGGDAQHSGWEGGNTRISKNNVKDLKLLFKVKLEVQPDGLRQLLPPIILGRLISYRGFKELAFVGSNADIVYAIDADLGTIFWTKHLEYSTLEPKVTTSTWQCPGGMTATPTMAVPGVTAARGAAARGGANNGFIGGPASVYAISSDGRLHRLNTSTGDDMAQPIKVLPANSRVSALTLVNDVIYAVTSPACNGTQNAVWAISLGGDAPTVKSFALNAGDSWGLGGPAIGSNGAVYVQTPAFLRAPSGGFSTLESLSAGDLGAKADAQLNTSVTNVGDRNTYGDSMNAPTPIVFQYRNRDFIVSADILDRLSLRDPASGKWISNTGQLAVSSPGDGVGYGIFGSLSTWQDAQGVRWIFAPVWGRVFTDLQVERPLEKGAIVAFKVEERDGITVLTTAWISPDMDSPLPPVVSNGVLFALSAGEITRQSKTSGGTVTVEERARNGTRATLYALDAATGKELYSSQKLIHGPASLTGITVANGRVYFGTTDGTFYVFGMYMEH